VGIIAELSEVNCASDIYSETAALMENVREQLKSGGLCVEIVITANKSIIKQLATLQGSLLKWPKLLFTLI
jgi:hypothetical protein